VCPTYYYDNPTEPPPFGAPYTSNSGARQNWGYGYELNIDAFWEFAFTLLNLHNVGLKNRINARVGGQFKFDKARRIQYLNTDYWPTTPTLIGTSLALSSQTFGGVGINFSQAPVSLTPNTNVIAYGFKHPTLVKTTLANLVATSPFSGGYGANMNGRLDDGFFGRVTTTTGAVYEWKKGDNWGF
jgi:hypothetical protein